MSTRTQYPFNGVCLGGPYDGKMLRTLLSVVRLTSQNQGYHVNGVYHNYLNLYWKWEQL